MQSVTAKKLLDDLSINKIPLEVCNINPDSDSVVKLQEKIKILHKNSASSSSVFFGHLIQNLYDLPIAIKMFLDPMPNFNCDSIEFFDHRKSDPDSLDYEIDVYKYVFNNIIEPNLSPNFISYVASGSCCWFEIENYFSDSERSNILTNLSMTVDNDKLLKREVPFNPPLKILITERVGNGAYFGKNTNRKPFALEEIFKRLSTDDQNKILFQIVFAVVIMQKFGIIHYDLHPGNILVDILDSEVTMGFGVYGKEFKITTKYIPYIFDWDFSYCRDLGANPKVTKLNYLNFNNNFDENDPFDIRQDLYILFCYLKWQPGTAARAFHTATAHSKEGEDVVGLFLNVEQENAIRTFPVVNKNVYKVPGDKLLNIIGSETEFVTKDVEVAIVLIDSHILYLYKGFKCRMMAVDKKYPTPTEILQNYFNDYICTDCLMHIPSKYVYSL